LANDLDVPVATSSLLQLPLLQRLIRRDQSVCVVTANAATMTEAHFDAVGVDSKVRERIYLAGLESCPTFQNFIHERTELDFLAAQHEVVEAVTKAVAAHPDTGAVLLECTNLPPFTPTIKKALGLPVWDAVSMINWLYAGASTP
jgi:hypothetical protein